MSERALAKLSEASELCGIPTEILKLMAADGRLPRVVRAVFAKPCTAVQVAANLRRPPIRASRSPTHRHPLRWLALP